jgi:hypothetical protein
MLIATLAIVAVGLICAIGPKRVLQFALEPVKAYAERMFVLQIVPSPKAVLVIGQVSKTNGATASGSFDTLGYDHATIDVVIATADTTTDGVSVLKLSESDDTTTTVTDIAQFTGGTATSATVGFVLPAGKTTGNTLVKMNVDLKKRKRYLTLTVSPRTTQINYALANLQRAEQHPVVAADAGVDALVNG